jgi:DNA-binding response OmpR family regulator/S1-C subfamily serine protease
MNIKPETVLLVEADEILREHLAHVLGDAGYNVSVDDGETVKKVLATDPDAVLLATDLQQPEWWRLLPQIKSAGKAHDIRVVLLSPGGSGERARALDLGADDVVSVPVDRGELLSRVRSQMRAKRILADFRDRLRMAQEDRSTEKELLTAVNAERRTLRMGGLLALTALIAAGFLFSHFYHGTQDQNMLVYSAITRLQAGIQSQQQLPERSSRNREADPVRPLAAASAEKLQLLKQSNGLKSAIAPSKPQDSFISRNELSAVEGRIQKLETENKFAENIIQSYEPSICLIHVVLSLRDRKSGQGLRYAGVNTNGEPITDEHSKPIFTLAGSGPDVHLDVFGTGFLVSGQGQILTNHHVAEPWWQNDDFKQLIEQGLEPSIVEMTAYFPDVPHGIAIQTEKISAAADVAVVKGNPSELRSKQIELADNDRSPVSGGPVVLLGYPTALDAILARAGAGTLESIASVSKGDAKRVMEELARRGMIRPISTQGHIGDVLPDKIIYDAQTALGGSGGPLFNSEGKVIGINFAMVREFSGSNLAIPVGFGKSLLSR